MATPRKPAHKPRQGAQAPRKLPRQHGRPQNPPAAPKSARKPTPKLPALPAKGKAAPRPTPKPASAAQTRPAAAPRGGHPAPGSLKASVHAPAPVAAVLLGAPDDPFDIKPTAYIPGVYTGWLRKATHWEGGHTCIAYRRTDESVSAIMAGQPIKLQDFSPVEFDQHWKPARLHGKPYPVERAVSIHLLSVNGWTDKALKALKQLRDGEPVDLNGEDAIEDILAIAKPKPKGIGVVRVRHEKMSKEQRRELRRNRRQKKLAAMTPKERIEWQAKRLARRKARKQERLAARKHA